jgi:ribonuclease PH
MLACALNAACAALVDAGVPLTKLLGGALALPGCVTVASSRCMARIPQRPMGC